MKISKAVLKLAVEEQTKEVIEKELDEIGPTLQKVIIDNLNEIIASTDFSKFIRKSFYDYVNGLEIYDLVSDKDWRQITKKIGEKIIGSIKE